MYIHVFISGLNQTLNSSFHFTMVLDVTYADTSATNGYKCNVFKGLLAKTSIVPLPEHNHVTQELWLTEMKNELQIKIHMFSY